VELALATPGVTLHEHADVTGISRDETGFIATLQDGRQFRAAALALAVPPSEAAKLLGQISPPLAKELQRMTTQSVHSLGVTVAKGQAGIERVAGIVPRNDLFYSAVSRDVIDDTERRGFTFHLRPGVSRDQALARIAVALSCPIDQLQHITERQVQLPAPVVGHDQVVAAAEKALLQGPKGLYLVGNYFTGLAIEDCVLRARAEANRLLAGTALA
jgi:UDP-galactopyranose mutase